MSDSQVPAKILFVDDEDKVFKSFQREVSFLPIELYYAKNGEEALKILENNKIDIIISDERMPGIKGSELISIVKTKYPEIVSIIITGYSDFDSIIKAINSGQVYKYILKPWDKIEMIMTIKNALEYKKDKELILKLKNELIKKDQVINHLESKYPGITEIKKGRDGSILLDLEEPYD